MAYTYSFIIPHRNSPEMLNRCLDSIPHRDDVQIIVVDDNSKEDKKPRISRTDVELVFIDASHSKGAGHARNIGLKYAKGEWLLFADCDDYYVDNFLDVLDSYNNTNLDVVYFNYWYLDGKSHTPLQDNYLQKIISNYGGLSSQTEYIKYRNNTPWNKMTSRVFVEKNNMYFEETVNGNDALFSLFIGINCKKFQVISDRIYVYLKNTNSLGSKKQSTNEVLCRVDHIVKHSYLNKAIGHSEWNRHLFQYVASILKKCGFWQQCVIIVNIFISLCQMTRHRKDWVKCLKIDK